MAEIWRHLAILWLFIVYWAQNHIINHVYCILWTQILSVNTAIHNSRSLFIIPDGDAWTRSCPPWIQVPFKLASVFEALDETYLSLGKAFLITRLQWKLTSMFNVLIIKLSFYRLRYVRYIFSEYFAQNKYNLNWLLFQSLFEFELS